MTKTMRGCLTAWSQTEGTEESEKNPGVPQQEEQPDTTDGKVIVVYNLDADFKPEGSDPEIEPVHHEEDNENSYAEYVLNIALMLCHFAIASIRVLLCMPRSSIFFCCSWTNAILQHFVLQLA